MESHRLVAGRVIDGFTLEERVHTGGMAALWRVTKAGETRPMLMKVPFLGEGDDPSAIVGFEIEHMILPRLTGPHVPACVAVGDFAVLPYLVMEHLPGESLDARAKQAPIATEDVLWLGAKIATALQDIHRQHVIHFDVKPANIILREEGPAVLLDYGLARHDELPDLLAEESDLPIGTSAYMAPEQVLGNRTDPRSDIFSLGAVLYELTTGHLPFGNPSSRAGMRQRLYHEPKPPRALLPHIPAWLQEIILKCLEVDPDHRYQTAGQLAHALRHPEQVVLTERAERVKSPGFLKRMQGWWQSHNRIPSSPVRIVDRLDRAPIIMTALDFSDEQAEAMTEAVRRMVSRLLATDTQARLVCLTILKTSLVKLDETLDQGGRNIYLKRLVAMKEWARELDLSEETISFHVIEAVDPAQAILDYAKFNQVDHIVMGARGHSTLRRYLGSVSSRIVGEAPCSVTVVRLPNYEDIRDDDNHVVDFSGDATD
jgi:eukaryotic-like serine/threonine-protein kinase